MASGNLAIGIGVLFIIISFVLLGYGLYLAYYKKRVLTTGQKWLYYGGAALAFIVAVILMIVGGNINAKAARLKGEA